MHINVNIVILKTEDPSNLEKHMDEEQWDQNE